MPVSLQNVYGNIPVSWRDFFTFRGLEFQFTWVEPAVPSGAQKYLHITTPADKYTLVSFREVQADQGDGFFRFWSEFTPGTFLSDPVRLIPMRPDAGIASQAVADRMSGPTFDADNWVVEVPMFGTPGEGGEPAKGNLSAFGAPRVIPPGATALLQLDNQANNPAYMRAGFRQWEVRPGALPEPGDV